MAISAPRSNFSPHCGTTCNHLTKWQKAKANTPAHQLHSSRHPKDLASCSGNPTCISARSESGPLLLKLRAGQAPDIQETICYKNLPPPLSLHNLPPSLGLWKVGMWLWFSILEKTRLVLILPGMEGATSTQKQVYVLQLQPKLPRILEKFRKVNAIS